MRILLVNPPDSGRSIPEERYGIRSLKQIMRGEPLALETLAGNLDGHEVRLVDLKADPEGLEPALAEFAPELVGVTAVTCEANVALRIAARAKAAGARVAVGGIHASCDPAWFNRPEVDYVVAGLGKASFRELVLALARGRGDAAIPGIGRTRGDGRFAVAPRDHGPADLVEDRPPRYDLAAPYRGHYVLPSLGLSIGFVAAAAGCPHRCSFCCIAAQTGGRYLPRRPDAVVRDIRLLPECGLIRLVDANSFGDPRAAEALREAVEASGLRRSFVADVRADTVTNHPDLLSRWKKTGLRSAVVGFEEFRDDRLTAMNKASRASVNAVAVAILHDLGITIVGDFIVSPDYGEEDFEALGRYIAEQRIELPMLTVETPLPGTKLYEERKGRIAVDDLDYYTLTNAVTPTRLPEERFYAAYAALLESAHRRPAL
jgi:radical SAM superfamily enzyme YgiQ (UPF0313 family)